MSHVMYDIVVSFIPSQGKSARDKQPSSLIDYLLAYILISVFLDAPLQTPNA